MKLTGIVHREGDTVWLDDIPLHGPGDVPRRAAFRGRVFYSTPTVRPSDLARLLGPDDQAFGSTPGKIIGVKIRLPKGSYKILASTTWGVDVRDPDQCYAQLSGLMIEAASSHMKVCSSVARTALQAYLDRYDGKGDIPAMSQLPCRWRGLAHAALHGGPLVVTRGSAMLAAHIDLRSAYLDALFQPLPVVGRVGDKKVGGWFTWDEKRWSQISPYTGFVDCTVWIEPDVVDKWGIPPLPVHLHMGSVFPTGRIRGCWSIELVRDAVERGEVEVLRVHQFCVAPVVASFFEQIADDFLDLPKALSKRLYTRFWGLLASRGGYVANKRIDLQEGEVPALGLAWKWDGIDMLSHAAPPTYRPDLAALIASYNHLRVIRAVRQLKPRSVVAVHVDAIWTTDIPGAAELCNRSRQIGTWQPVQDAPYPLRYYGTGAYQHGERLAASGYDASTLGPLTPHSLQTWANGARPQAKLLLKSRVWCGDPAQDKDASSRPLHLDLGSQFEPVDTPHLQSPDWSNGGWYRAPAPPSIGNLPSSDTTRS